MFVHTFLSHRQNSVASSRLINSITTTIILTTYVIYNFSIINSFVSCILLICDAGKYCLFKSKPLLDLLLFVMVMVIVKVVFKLYGLNDNL